MGNSNRDCPFLKQTEIQIGIFRSKDMTTIVQLRPLEHSDREQFVLDNQEAFNYGALEEFGLRDNHFEEDGQINITRND